MPTLKKLTYLVFTLCAICIMGRFTVTAQTLAAPQPQTSDTPWSEPLNLSRSGAAGQPVIITGPEGLLQAFWWDQFDGIITAINAGETWSEPARAPIVTTELVGQGDNAFFVSTPIAAMPGITGDNAGAAHALWLGAADEETGLRPLLTSRLVLSTTTWTAPTTITGSALKWSMAAGADGTLHLVYVRTTHTAADPAGLVYRRSTNNGVTWSPPVVLYTSIYFRLLQSETAHLNVIADGLGSVLVTSETFRPQQPFIIRSADAGATWEEPFIIGTDELHPIRADLILADSELAASEVISPSSELLLLWQAEDESNACVLVQQRSFDSGVTWSAPERVLEGATTCAQTPTFLPTAGGDVLRVTGGGSGSLAVEIWDPSASQWSETQSLSLAFENPELGTPVTLNPQILQLLDGRLSVAGTGQDGEIWFLQSDLDLFAWAFAPPSPWSGPVNIADRPGLPGMPSVAADSEGRVHVLWSEAQDAAQPGTIVLYSRWDGNRWSSPTVVDPVSTGKADQPALVVVGDRLHAVWSSGPEGQIYYSRAYVRDANAANSWSEAQVLSGLEVGGTPTGSASAPAIAVDLLGRLHVAYAVPVNDGRGIYYTVSADEGDSWTEPVQVFDAVTEGWLRADNPTLTVDERGIVHVAWLRAPLPGYGLPEAVYYARSIDNGETWSAPYLLAEGLFNEPRLVATLHGQLLAFWRDLRQDIVRYRVSGDGGAVWDTISTIPGFRSVTGPVGLGVDGSGAVHAVSLTQAAETPALLYAVWDADRWQTEPSWSPAWPLPDDFVPISGAAVAVQGPAGQLDILLPAGKVGAGLWIVTRTIEPIVGEPIPLMTLEPTPTPTPAPTSTPTPTPHPTVAPDAGDPGMPILEVGPLSQPLSAVWGILIALLAVGALLLRQTMKR